MAKVARVGAPAISGRGGACDRDDAWAMCTSEPAATGKRRQWRHLSREAAARVTAVITLQT